jgi:tetratricopeptide (TPR) repeat protein
MSAPATVPDLPRDLGDFRILREIGRGGMGVVYEAEQKSLRRRVALKVLPFAAGLDPKRLARFRIEVQAAARLHHSNIVPVYAVGEEAGVHFTAMQFVQGRPLDAVIRELRATGNKRSCDGSRSAEAASITSSGSTRNRAFFRAVAELGIQAADALDHAHEMGVVHRDVKPSNLLVDTDGTLWVADFGLAELEDAASEAGTQGLAGTLRYASPEQVKGRRTPMDHRTDVYSLGATLYELIALRPAFSGENRAALLHHIALDEPPRLRRTNPAVPPPLETIVHAAMAKTPDERYASARALSEDLRRYLADRPIEARRSSLFRRSIQWVRRHRALSTAAAGILVVLVAFLAVTTAVLWQEREANAAALRTTEASARRAEANYARTLSVVDRVVSRIGEASLAPAPGLNQVRATVLQKALAFYKEARPSNPDDPAFLEKVGRTLMFRARYLGELRRIDKAEAAYLRAIEILGRVAGSPGGSSRAEMDQVQCLAGLGRLLGQPQHRRREGIEHLKKAIAAQESILARFPTAAHRRRLIGFWLDLADVQRREGLPKDRVRSLACALGLQRESMKEDDGLEAQRDLATLYNMIGLGRMEDEQYAAAEEPLRSGIAIYRRLLRDETDSVRLESELGAQLHNLAIVVFRAGQLKEALGLVDEAIEHQQKAFDSNRFHPQYRELLSNHHHLVAEVNLERGDHAAAAKASAMLPRIRPEWLQSYFSSSSIFIRCHRIAGDDPDAADGYARKARALIDHAVKNAGNQPAVLNQIARYLTSVRQEFRQPERALELARRAAAGLPDGQIAHCTLALAAYRAGRLDEALAAAEKALRLPSKKQDAFAGYLIAMIRARCGKLDAARAQLRESAAWMEKNHAHCQECRRMQREAEQVLQAEAARAKE